jgi:hypothetical protein
MVSVGKSEGKRQLGRPKSTWQDNIKMGLKAMGWCFGLIRLRISTSGGMF